MNIEIEKKIVVHVEDGYFKQIIIENNPDAPEISGRIVVRECFDRKDPWKQLAEFTFNNEEAPKIIEALQMYINKG